MGRWRGVERDTHIHTHTQRTQIGKYRVGNGTDGETEMNRKRGCFTEMRHKGDRVIEGVSQRQKEKKTETVGQSNRDTKMGRETQRDRERQSLREKESQGVGEGDRQTQRSGEINAVGERQREKDAETDRDRHREGETNIEKDVQTEKETAMVKERKINSQRERLTQEIRETPAFLGRLDGR